MMRGGIVGEESRDGPGDSGHRLEDPPPALLGRQVAGYPLPRQHVTRGGGARELVVPASAFSVVVRRRAARVTGRAVRAGSFQTLGVNLQLQQVELR